MAHVGPFHLEGLLGRGATGEVHRARHQDSDEVVAVKILTPAHRERWASLVRREVEAVARLDHPGVVWIHDHGDDPELGPWLALELASGGTLADAPPITSWTALRVLLGELLGALGHAHAHGVLHRDLKPANVLVCTLDDARPGPKLADFSLSRIGAAAAPGGGTPDWWAPEQRDGRARAEGPWTDLYGLGALAWAVACGGPPSSTGWRPRLVVPGGFRSWVGRLLQDEPADRFAGAAIARAALDALGGGEVASAPELPTRDTFDDDDLGSAAKPHPRRSAASRGLIGLRPVPLVGRDDELAAIRRARSAAAAGRGPAVVRLVGEPGVGKSRLLDAVEVAARERGDVVVRRTLAVTDAWTPVDDPSATAVGFARWAAGVGSPVLVVLDDADDADLVDLAAARAPHLAVVAAGEGRAPAPGVTDVPVGRLKNPAQLARALGVTDGSAAYRVGEWSGGLPARVVGAVRRWVREGVLRPGPDGWVVVGTLPEPAPEAPIPAADRPVLEVLALCGAVATPAVWATACEAAGVAWTADHAEALRRSGLLATDGPPRLADGAAEVALIRDREASGGLPALAAAVGGVLAREVPRGPARDEQLGRCWEHAGWWLEAAGAWFAAAIAPQRLHDAERRHGALDGAERALTHAPDPDLDAKIRIWRAATRSFDGDPAEVLIELLAMEVPDDPRSRHRHRTFVGDLEHASGRWRAAAATLCAAAEQCPPGRDAEMALERAAGALLDVDRGAEAVALLDARDFPVASLTRGRLALARGDLDAAAVHLIGPPREVQAPLWELCCLELRIRRGEPSADEAEAQFASLSGRHRRLRTVAAALWCLAAAMWRPATLADAEAAAREAVAVARLRWRWPRDLLLDAAASAPRPLAARLRGLAEELGPLD